MIQNQIGKKTIISVIFGIAGQLLLVITGIISARILGVEYRGYLALIVLIPAVLVQFGNLGLPKALTYFVAKEGKNIYQILYSLSNIFFFQFLILFITHTLIIYTYLRVTPELNEAHVAVYSTLVVIPGMLCQQYAQSALQGLGEFGAFNKLRLVQLTLYALCLILIFSLKTGDFTLVTIIYSVSVFSSGVIAVIVTSKTLLKEHRTTETLQSANKQALIKFGIKGLIGSISPIEHFRFDQIVVGLLLSPTSLGIYIVAKAFANFPTLIANSVCMVIYPIISSKNNTVKAKKYMWQFWIYLSIINSVFVFIIIMIMPQLIFYLFGIEFISSSPVARILIFGALIYSSRWVIIECARGLGKPEISTKTEILMYPLLIIIGMTIVPGMGLMGVGVSIVISNILSLLYAFYLVKKV